MTKEEIIMRGKQLGFPRLSKKSHDNQATMITTIVEEAVRLEREECAKVCEEVGEHPSLTPLHCAESIRARGEA